MLSSEEARALLTGMGVSTVVGLLIAVMTYSFARVGAVVALKAEDYFSQKKRMWLRLREKNSKVNEMPCHHALELYLDEYLAAAGTASDRKEPLFRSLVEEARALLTGMDVSHVVGLRDRASIAGMTCTFARVGVVVALKGEVTSLRKKRMWPLLREKNGKGNERA